MFTFRSLNELDATEGTVKLLDGNPPPFFCLISPAADIAGTHRLKNKEGTDIVLVPQPTDDPNDPLNWPRWKKVLAFAAMSLFAIESGWNVGGGGTAIVLLMNEFHTDLNTTVDGVVNWMVLLLGLGVYSSPFPC